MLVPLKCKRLLKADDSFDALQVEWQHQAAKFEPNGSIYGAPQMVHANSIASENPPPKNYGIFALHDGAAHHAIFHANAAMLPGTTGWTLRVLWVLLAPIYDYEDRTQDDIHRVTSSIIHQSIDLCSNGLMPVNHLKIHLQNVGDRRFAIALAEALKEKHNIDTGVRGNWLHFDGVC